MQGFEFLAGEAQLHAAEGIRFDEINEFPENLARRKFQLDLADGHRWDDSLQQAADGAGEADVYLRDAEFGVAVGALVGEIDVIYANDLAAVGVYDLLVQEVFAYCKPGFVGMVERQGGFVGCEADAAGGDRGDLVVTGDERAILAAAQQKVRDAVGLVGGLDEHFFYAADVVAEGVVGLSANDLCGVQHGCSLGCVSEQKKSPGRRMEPATGAQKSPYVATGRASPPCPRIIRRSSEPTLAGKFPAPAERPRIARRGGDFPVPNWTAAPLRCAVVL